MRLLRLPVHPSGFRGQSLRTFAKTLGTLALVPAIYLMMAIIGAVVPGGADHDEGPKTREILLVHGPIHYDLLLPLDAETIEKFTPLAAQGIWLDHPEARWLVIGWGAEHFYTQTRTYTDLSLPAIFSGITGDKTVLRFDIAGVLAEDLPARRVRMTQQQYAALLESIWSSFALAPEGTPQRLDVAGYTSSDGFFAGLGRFNILRTCNVWIGERLRAAGLRFGLWTPMPLSVSLSYDLYQAE